MMSYEGKHPALITISHLQDLIIAQTWLFVNYTVVLERGDSTRTVPTTFITD